MEIWRLQENEEEREELWKLMKERQEYANDFWGTAEEVLDSVKYDITKLQERLSEQYSKFLRK